MTSEPTNFEDLVRRVAAFGTARRSILAIAGAPGSGKSTLADRLAEALNGLAAGAAAVLPMDGYHFDDRVLIDRGLRPRKGAPNTFDVGGLAHMLQRLRRNEEEEIAVPVFDRDLEIARAGARLIPQSIRWIIVEGNYLLFDQAPWSRLRPMFDLTVFVDVPEDELRRRLIRRWQGYGLAPDAVEAKLEDNDLPNGRAVIKHSQNADIVLRSEGM